MPFVKGHVPSSFTDMSGQRCGMLTVGERVFEEVRHAAKWSCRCDCGNVIEVTGSALRDGQYCCGCVLLGRRTHAMSRTPTYRAWSSMKQRCLNPKANGYELYGGRGIAICERWRHSFENFLADMGEAPDKGYSVERKDNDLGYDPSNCCWIPRREQGFNRRNIIYVEINGERVRAKDAAQRFGVKYTTFLARIQRGMSVAEAAQ